MTAPFGVDTTALLASILPIFSVVVAQRGEDVLVRRPGQPDAAARGLVYRLEESGGAVDDPTVPVPLWEALLPAAVPVEEWPFFVVHGARILVPIGPSEDLAGQGVAWRVRLLELEGHWRTHALSFPTPGPVERDPKTGNRRPAPGPPVSAVARLLPTDDPRTIARVGADTTTAVLIGRWGELGAPARWPDGVKPGASSPLAVDGRPGTLTLAFSWPEPHGPSALVYGERFLATWRDA